MSLRSLFRPSAPKPAAPKPAAQPQQIVLGQQLVNYQLQRSQRRSIGFLINDSGLRVSAPNWLALHEVEQAILEKRRWILDKLAQRAQQVAARPDGDFVWQDGAKLPYLGRELQLRILAANQGKSLPALLDESGQNLILSSTSALSSEKIRSRTHTWLQAQAEHLFLQRLNLFAAKMGVGYASLSLSAARTQWGSCSAHGKIRLNWRLIHFAPDLIDYVVIHELAHRREMNHSPRFWAQVEQHYPAYEVARKRLQLASRALPPGL